MKKILVFAVAGMALAACSNEEEGLTAQQQGATNSAAVYFTPENAETRGAMTTGLLNTWNSGDVVGVFSQYDASGVMTNNGAQNATFTFNSTYNTGSNTYTNVFVQSGGEIPVVWQDATSKHNFYLYFPRTDMAASASAVPFSLSNRQTQSTKDEWNTTNGQYNFMWKAIKGATRPYDQTIPFSLNRMLPVAQFSIVRDGNQLDGYSLTQVELKPTTGTMGMGNTTVNLTNAGNISSLSFGSTTDSYVVYANNGFAVNSVDMYKSFNIYMSVPPAAAREYTATATFSNGSDTKIVEVTRSDAFTITNGKGNLVNYYFNASTMENGGNGGNDEDGNTNTGYSVVVNGLTWAPANLVYIDNTWRFAKVLTECYPDIASGVLFDGSAWAAYGSKATYWQFGYLNPTDNLTSIWGTGGTIGAIKWTASNDPCRQVAGGQWRLPDTHEANALVAWMDANTQWTGVVQGGRTFYGRLYGQKNTNGTLQNNATFFPAAGCRAVSNGTLVEVGEAGNYVTSTNDQGDPTGVYCNAFSIYSTYTHSYGMGHPRMGYSVRCVRY